MIRGFLYGVLLIAIIAAGAALLNPLPAPEAMAGGDDDAYSGASAVAPQTGTESEN